MLFICLSVLREVVMERSRGFFGFFGWGENVEENRPTDLLFSLSFISSSVPYPKQAGMMTECVYKTSPPVHAQCVTPKFSSTEKNLLSLVVTPSLYSTQLLLHEAGRQGRGGTARGEILAGKRKNQGLLSCLSLAPPLTFFLQRQSCIRGKNRPAAAAKEKGEFCACVCP